MSLDIKKADTLFSLIPSFDGEIGGTYDCREETYMRLYENETKEHFEEYISVLLESDYSLLQKREFENNAYAALKKDVQINILYTDFEKTIRITVSEKDQTPCFEKTDCNGETTTAFYGFESDHTIIDCGMCLLVQCPDNSFFIVDSGHYFQFNDNDRIYRFMRDRTPEGEKIVINGWFITHAHTDHISKLIDFLKYNTHDVIIEGFYQNLLCNDYGNQPDNHEEPEMAGKLFRVLEEFPAPVYKLHTGMRFYIRNLTFDVLGTHEDMFPDFIEDYNDSSTILMMTAEGSKVFIPGDAAVLASEKLEKRCPASLKCDVVQIAHHGHTGLSEHCYELLNAPLAVFPVTRIMFEQDLPRHAANRKAIELAKKYYITSDGTVCVPLPFDINTVYTLPDETVEDFEKIKRIWRYVYTDEYKAEIYDQFLAHGGDENKLVIPSSPGGWIEPKPYIEGC